jgi:pyridoxal phosphate enzyme (YggS family)
LIHSLDSENLAKEIDARAKKAGKNCDVLVEINIAEEPNKSGILPAEVDEFICKIDSLYDNIKIKGIMTIGPVLDKNLYEICDYKKIFEKTYKIFIDILQKKIHNIDKPILSMGMSDTYDIAVECGSNLVRLGTALYGKRGL